MTAGIVADIVVLHVLCVSYKQEFLNDMAVWGEVNAYDGKIDALKLFMRRHVMHNGSVMRMMHACKDLYFIYLKIS